MRTRLLLVSRVLALPVLLVAVALTTGVYVDRESGDPHWFAKHRPSPHFCFRAPVGESDIREASLPPAERAEELRYEEFVERGYGYRRTIRLPWNPCPSGPPPPRERTG